MTHFRIDVSRIETNRAAMTKCVAELVDHAAKLADHGPELRASGMAYQHVSGRLAAAWQDLVDDVEGWVEGLDSAVEGFAHSERTASQTDSDVAHSLTKLA